MLAEEDSAARSLDPSASFDGSRSDWLSRQKQIPTESIVANYRRRPLWEDDRSYCSILLCRIVASKTQAFDLEIFPSDKKDRANACSDTRMCQCECHMS